MIKRWLIRSFFIMLLAACVVVWVASDWYRLVIDHTPDGRQGIICDVEYGTLVLKSPVHNGSRLDVRMVLGRGRLVDAYIHPAFGRWFTLWYWQCQWHIGGFAWDWKHHDGGWMVMIPMWFPTILCALLLWFVWRKTKPKGAGRAFPVEAGGNMAGECKP